MHLEIIYSLDAATFYLCMQSQGVSLHKTTGTMCLKDITNAPHGQCEKRLWGAVFGKRPPCVYFMTLIQLLSLALNGIRDFQSDSLLRNYSTRSQGYMLQPFIFNIERVDLEKTLAHVKLQITCTVYFDMTRALYTVVGRMYTAYPLISSFGWGFYQWKPEIRYVDWPEKRSPKNPWDPKKTRLPLHWSDFVCRTGPLLRWSHDKSRGRVNSFFFSSVATWVVGDDPPSWIGQILVGNEVSTQYVNLTSSQNNEKTQRPQ